MKKIFFLVIFIFSNALTNHLKAQDKYVDSLYHEFSRHYNNGDLVGAEKKLLLILDSNKTIPAEYKAAVFNNLGATCILLGKYQVALDYYSKAEILINNKENTSLSLGNIYINKAIIYGFQKSYPLAIEYFEKGIKIYLGMKSNEKSVFSSLSSAYLNLGIVYLEIKDYKSALEYFTKSAEIKSKFKLPGLALVYLNIAKSYIKAENKNEAENFYLKSISSLMYEYNENYFRLAEVYFDYGLFLKSAGRNDEAWEAHQKALSICLKNYGEKHSLVSFAYKLIGDDCLHKSDYNLALSYYQKSLIAIVTNFENPDIYSNPSIDSSLFDIRLLDNLKSKAQALELFAGEQKDPENKIKTIRKGLETIELALQLVDNIRNKYLSEESRIYLAENEKETYIYAAHLAFSLFSLSHDVTIGNKMYEIAMKAKAAVLRNEIKGNEILYSSGIPDTLREKQNRLASDIAAYNNLIIAEKRKLNPDSSKISLWKDALFDMNREKEEVSDEIARVFPQYHDLITKTEPVSLREIQKQLTNNETIVDYLLSNQYSGGKRKLYIFLITRNRLEFRETSLDSLFNKNSSIIRMTCDPSLASGKQNENFSNYAGALHYMYLNLIKPVEGLFAGNNLIIIPDEEIGWLPFDSFLRKSPGQDQTDYEGLHYLINDFTFSYGYSSSLIFSKNSRLKRGAEVFSFSPDYSNTTFYGEGLDSLQGANDEIESIYKWFFGETFTGNRATKVNFLKAIQKPAIFHLAMHSMSDSVNSRYSYMLFDTHNCTVEDSKLYNYEISLSRIKSPMVVLSACNSGTGTLYYGEGLMSLARGFILAGASSVIKTSWEVNDEVSSAIITRFYYYLSKGKEKDIAMRLAKLDYLKNSSPAFTNPYYWAAYEVLGDNAPVVRNRFSTVLIMISLILILSGVLLCYFKRHRIFSDRSR
ncbi:MAG: CHAT domain-containing protein [Bacteroidales bacterium]|nr:CHAT domain-containing protein [Bacteroidales bacterium]